MNTNPFKYLGPLDVERDKQVCLPREKDVNKIIKSIPKGSYWGILGPRQIGKTTFLRLLREKLENIYYIVYMDFEDSIKEDNPYMDIVTEILKITSATLPENLEKDMQRLSPHNALFNFLQKFEPKEHKKIIFLFDEIDGLPQLKKFLHSWRKIYSARDNIKKLGRYVVIISGSTDLVKLTIGRNSPYNIAEKLYLPDFSVSESRTLISNTFNKSGITVGKEANTLLVSQISGHPQILQHACHILYEKAITSNSTKIAQTDIVYAINRLFKDNQSLGTLEEDIKKNNQLRALVKDLMDRKKKKFLPYREFSTLGAGAIKEECGHCEIRNEIFKMFINECEIHLTKSSKKASVKQMTSSILYPVLLFLFGIIAEKITSNSNGLWIGIVLALSVILSILIYKRKNE